MASHTTSFYPYLTEIATASMRIQDDGSLVVRVPVHDHGCGTVMAMKKMAGEIFEIGLDKIELLEADTQNSEYDYGCYGSRTLYVFGKAIIKCAEELLEKARKMAARKLGCMPNTVWYEEGEFFLEDAPDERVTLKDVWEYAVFTAEEDLYHTVSTHASKNPGTPAVHFAQVKVDTYTGRTEVEHCLSVHEVGKAIIPDMCYGQIGSGIQQGIGVALCEEIKIDPKTGKTLITNFKNYEIANAYEMPDYDALLIEDEEESGPFGAKGIGEVVLAPIAPAIAAAVSEALGKELTRLPLTPAVILEAIREGQA